MGRIKFLVVIGGIALFVYGVQEMRLASAASKDPQTLSCAELAAKGPGDNAHVVLTDFLLCDQAFIYETKSKSKSSEWKRVWVPLVPRDGDYVRKILAMANPDGPLPPPTDIRVLLKTSRVKDARELDPLGSSKSLTGLITNKIDSLGTKERKMLEESYPGIDFTKCYILDHDRKPASSGQIAGALGGGALLVLAGGAWLLAGRRQSA